VSFTPCIVCEFDSHTILFKCPQRKSPPPAGGGRGRNPHPIQKLKENISHAIATIKITMSHPVYLNMVTARLLTNCSNTLRNIHTNAREIFHKETCKNGRWTTLSRPTLYLKPVYSYMRTELNILGITPAETYMLSNV